MRMAKVVLPLCRVGRPAFHIQGRCLFPAIFAVRYNTQPDTQQKSSKARKHQLPYSTPISPLDFQSRGLRLVQSPSPSDLQQSTSGSGSDSELQDDKKKSRNQYKREARKAVQWGMDLVTFSVSQIKFIIRAASLDEEIFSAIMVAKRLGPDVREGKRRQFNYIGRLLREAQPEQLDDLIQATKDGDQIKLRELSSAGECIIEEDESEPEEEEGNFTVLASRWFNGLIDKDSDITNEVYSIHSVAFDRQELRKLVRTIQNLQSRQLSEENKVESSAALAGAKKSMIRLLRSVAKQMEHC